MLLFGRPIGKRDVGRVDGNAQAFGAHVPKECAQLLAKVSSLDPCWLACDDDDDDGRCQPFFTHETRARLTGMVCGMKI